MEVQGRKSLPVWGIGLGQKKISNSLIRRSWKLKRWTKVYKEVKIAKNFFLEEGRDGKRAYAVDAGDIVQGGWCLVSEVNGKKETN